MTTDVPVPAADHIGSSPWTTAFSRVEVPTERSGHVRWWYRFAEPIGDAPLYQAAALAYLTDDVPGEAVMDAHDRPPVNRFENGEWIGASLDHALWFHAPVQVDAWHLHDVRCISYAGGRGLSIGTIFAADGTHVATVSQEGHLVPRLVGAP